MRTNVLLMEHVAMVVRKYLKAWGSRKATLFGVTGAGFALCCALSTSAYAQEDYSDLDLEALLDVEIIELVTKKAEPLFESSLSVSVLHASEIAKAGATSIPEALRLIPGIIVREQTAGNFDVHIQGFDNVSVNKLLPFPSSTIMLVMVDYRVVYNYFAGGTFWETLPIGMNDIERIEVIRGPASALYGPNAAAGVINIVTRTPKDTGLYRNAAINFKSKEDYSGTGAIGWNHSNDWTSVLSFNVSQRNRFQKEYFDWAAKDYREFNRLTTVLKQPDIDNLDDPQYLLEDIDTRYPDPETALKKYGVNLATTYKFSSEANVRFNAGVQDSFAQKIYVNNFSTPITSNTSATKYFDLRGQYKALSAQISTTSGEQAVEGMKEWKYDLDVVDALVDYSITFDKLLLRPGVSFRQASYDGEFIGGEQELSGVAFSVLADYSMLKDDLRLLAAARMDTYSHPDDNYASYQLSSRYKLNVNHTLHAAYSRANRAPFMVDNYVKYVLETSAATVEYLGNTDLKQMTVDTFDLGWRGKFAKALTLDLNGFYSDIYYQTDLEFKDQETVAGKATVRYQYEDTNRQANQVGFTTSLEVDLDKIFTFTPYVTVQDTKYYSNKEDEDKEAVKTTPEVIGGAKINSVPMAGLNLNLNGYYLGEQVFPNYNGSETETIDNVFVLNAKLAYAVSKDLDVFVNGRNLAAKGDGEKEYGYADKIGSVVFVGIQSPAVGD